MNDLLKNMLDPEQRLIATALDWAPTVFIAVVAALAGLAVAWLTRLVVRSLVRRLGLDALAERLGVVRLLYSANVKGGVDALAGNLAGFAVLLITSMVVAETLGLTGVADGFASLVGYLPRFLTAVGLALVGFVAADLASRLAETVGRRRGDLVAPALAARVVYYGVLAIFLTTATTHLGLDTDLADSLIVLTIGVALATAGLALALGSQPVVQSVLARQYVRPVLSAGDNVRIGSVEGVVVSFDTVTLSLRTPDGGVHVVPWRVLLDDDGVLIQPDDGDPDPT